MTGEEMERAIEFLLQSQANSEARQAAFDARLDRLTEQVAETGRQLQMHAETQTEFIQIVTQHIEAQGRFNAEFRAAQARTDEALARANESQARTNEALERTNEALERTNEDVRRLAATVERYIEGRG